jgi:ribosomal-protein-serine acetyltransferase
MTLAQNVIATPRLRLVPTVSGHAEDLWAAAEASLRELRPWMQWAVDTDRSSTRDFTIACERTWMADMGWPHTIYFGDECAGTVSLDRHDSALRSCYLGYWIRSELGGRGLMTEAASALVEFGFETVGLHRIELHAATENAASIRVAEKIGFRRGGLLRDGSRGEKGWHDVYVYDLLETDERRGRTNRASP